MVAAETTPSGTAEVHIRDNGPGFDPAMVDQGFFPFATTKADGIGLGLSLSRSIVESHGGRLSVDGDATGAVVTFTLPAADQQNRGTLMAIALIDDDEAVLDSLRIYSLKKQGFETACFASAVASRKDFESILSVASWPDVRMPDMSGH